VARGALPSGGPRVSPLRVAGDVSRHHPVSRGLSLPTCPSYRSRGLSWWSTCKPQSRLA